jgi:hypothetical protein
LSRCFSISLFVAKHPDFRHLKPRRANPRPVGTSRVTNSISGIADSRGATENEPGPEASTLKSRYHGGGRQVGGTEMSQLGSTISNTAMGGDGSATATGAPRRSVLVVLLSGVVTTVLALLGVWWLDNNTTGWHVMGWYGDYVIPAGALIVGVTAGLGYGVASYLTGLRIRRGLLLCVLALQLAAYAAAQYLEFRSFTGGDPLIDETGQVLTFTRYYHLRAINFAWDNHGHPGEPLGNWGYFFIGLGVVGFVLGGVLAPAVLMKKPYCAACALYMKSRTLALVPASIPNRKVSKKDPAAQAAFQEENARAAATAEALIQRMTDLSAKGDAIAINTALIPYPPRGTEARSAGRLPARLRVVLASCRQCFAGHLQPAVMTGQGRGIRVRPLPAIPLRADAARMIAQQE